MARRQDATERLTGSFGASLASPGLRFEIDMRLRLRLMGRARLMSAPALLSPRKRDVVGPWASAQRDIGCALRQFLTEAALIEFRHEGALELVALVEEGELEGKADIIEDLGILGPDDHRARTHHRRQIAVDEGVAGEVGEAHHLAHGIAALIRLGEGFHL